MATSATATSSHACHCLSFVNSLRLQRCLFFQTFIPLLPINDVLARLNSTSQKSIIIHWRFPRKRSAPPVATECVCETQRGDDSADVKAVNARRYAWKDLTYIYFFFFKYGGRGNTELWNNNENLQHWITKSKWHPKQKQSVSSNWQQFSFNILLGLFIRYHFVGEDDLVRPLCLHLVTLDTLCAPSSSLLFSQLAVLFDYLFSHLFFLL